jgi:hypothetical protein
MAMADNTYTFSGVASEVAHREDAKGKPYAIFVFSYTSSRGADQRRVIVNGDTLATLGKLENGPLRLVVRFEGGKMAVVSKPGMRKADPRQLAMAV